MSTAMQEKETKRSYAFIGYALADLIGLAGGVAVCFVWKFLLDSVMAYFGMSVDMTLGSVAVGLTWAVCIAAHLCMVVWLIAERPLSNKNGYIDLPEHCVMTVLAAQVWNPIWVFHTTKCLNRADGKKSIPWLNMILCLLVPFYIIFWYFRQGKKVDALASERVNYKVKTSVLCLLLGLLVAPFVSNIVLQKRINDIAA